MKKMRNIKLLTILIILIPAWFSADAYGQCTNSSSYGSATAPTGTSAVTISTCNYQTEYSTISNVVAGNQYQATYDLGGYITVHSGSYNGTVVASGNAPLTWTATVSGTYYIHYNTNSSCGTNNSCGTSTISCVSCGGGTPAAGSCLDALPFCTSNAYTFPASTNVPDMGSVGCLYTTPNPAWYWMEIGSPGNIDIYMTSGGDVDFIAWGPFTSLSAACASNLMSNSGVDCSYSTAAQETANLVNTQTGEVYVLLITNYANIVTNISFSQTGGAGSTNCGIIAPPITNNGPLCEGQTLQLSVSNPTAGATYLWSGPNSWSSTVMNPVISNVTSANAGTYSLVITVGANTSPPVTTDVVINPNVTPTFASVGPYCSGASIPALPTTSTNGITGTWSPAICNTSTTTYTFTPSAGQCATTATKVITITPNVTPTFSSVGPYCSGASIPALPTTSTNGITGSWSPAICNTSTTTYTFTPAAGQCATTTTMTITINPLITPTFTAAGSYCSGASVSALPATSNNSITGSWSPAICNTSTTTYTFTPSSGQCATNAAMTITINPNILPSFNPSGPYCSGTSISALPATSNNSITGSWSPAINNTATTNYTFTPTAGQCATTASLIITINPNILPSFTPAGPYCTGTTVPDLPSTSNNGITGSWSPAINNTQTTTYTFTPTAGQCATTTTTDIEIESVGAQLVYSTNQFCDAQGTAEVSGVGGTLFYSYIWPDEAGGISGGTATDLDAGSYIVTITDAHGCLATQEFSVGFVNNMSASASVISNPSCNGNADASAYLSISQGTAPYNISWGDENFTSCLSSNTLTGLSQGNYVISVTDSIGCDIVTSVAVVDPAVLTASATFTPIKCFGETAIVTVSATGGTMFYDGTGVFNSPAGTYSYTVTDSHNCQSVVTVNIPEAPSPIEINSSVRDVTCFGLGNGSISINVTGGTPSYAYMWSNSLSGPSANNLQPGIYSVVVKDINQCSQTGSYTISEPAEIDFDFTVQNLLCYGAATGSVQMIASGGNDPYTFEISGELYSATGSYHGNLTEGYYDISVHDANGCSKIAGFSVYAPSELVLSVASTDPSCRGNNDGLIEISATGGTEPYLYILDQMLFDINYIGNMREGTYKVEVLDANDCRKSKDEVVLTDVQVDCIKIPNAFTPNGDAVNDTWIIENLWKFPQSVTQVFNRWGQPVYFGTPDDDPWDGYFNGHKVPAGTYVFYINLYNGEPPYTGVVTVVH